MKLNNRGWGLREMLVLSAILIFFFCVAIYFIYLFYSSFSNSFNNEEKEIDMTIYETYEQILYDAGENYLENIDDFKDSIINMSTLINEGYMKEIYDPETENECNGYIKVLDVENKEMDEYIKCDNYETVGY